MPSERAMTLVREIARILDEDKLGAGGSLERAAERVDEAFEAALEAHGVQVGAFDLDACDYDEDEDAPDLDDPTEDITGCDV